MRYSYLSLYSNRVAALTSSITDADFDLAADALEYTKRRNKKVLLIGNGGSAAICSHLAVDLTKSAGVPALCFSDAGLQTCFANDYGYENAFSNMIKFYGKSDDLLIAISSSGRSKNIINATERSIENGLRVVTLSGFDNDNPLRKAGHINFYVESSEYNLVENSHEQVLLALCDRVRLGKSKFMEFING